MSRYTENQTRQLIEFFGYVPDDQQDYTDLFLALDEIDQRIDAWEQWGYPLDSIEKTT